MNRTTSIQTICLLLLFALFSCKDNSAGETKTDTTQDTLKLQNVPPEPESVPIKDSIASNDPVAFIKKEFARINAASLTKKSYTYQCDELMKIDYYYEGKDVVKAVVDYGTVGDHYQKSEFYYQDGRLVFFYDFVEGGPACEGCEMKLEHRYYVKDDLVIKYIKNDKEVKCTTCNFSQKSVPYRTLQAAKTLDFKTAFCS